MIGIGDALSFVADVIDGEHEVNSAIKKSNDKTKRNVAGIAALGAVAAFGIHVLTNNKKEQKKER